MSNVSRAMEKLQERRKIQRTAGASPRSAPRPSALAPIRRGTRAQAVEKILADALADGEGFSFGAVGSPRYGKTHFLAAVLEAARERGLVEVALIHDTKRPGQPQYPGVICAGVDDFIVRADELATAPAIVLNSESWLSQPSPQEACEMALAIREESRAKVAVVLDEVYKATDGFGNWQKSEVNGRDLALFPLFLREGTSQNISTLWTTQIPQELPTACKVLTRAVAQFHLESLAADAATEKFRLDADGPAILRALVRGEFVLFCQGSEWDRTIYGPG